MSSEAASTISKRLSKRYLGVVVVDNGGATHVDSATESATEAATESAAAKAATETGVLQRVEHVIHSVEGTALAATTTVGAVHSLVTEASATLSGAATHHGVLHLLNHRSHLTHQLCLGIVLVGVGL